MFVPCLRFFFLYIFCLFFANGYNVVEDEERSRQINTLKSIVNNDNLRLRYGDYPLIYIYREGDKKGKELCDTTGLDVHWVQDTTKSFDVWLSRVKKHIPSIFKILETMYAGSSLAVSGFTDRQKHDEPSERLCYTLYSDFISSVEDIERAVSKIECSQGGGTREDSLSALYYAVELNNRKNDASQNSSKTKPARRKFLLLITDAEGKAYNAKAVRADLVQKFISDNITATCTSQGYPSIEQLQKKLQETNTTPLFIVPEKVARFYNNLLFELNVGGTIIITDFESPLVERMKDAVRSSVCAQKLLESGADSEALAPYPEYGYRHSPNQSLSLLPNIGFVSSTNSSLCLGIGCNEREQSGINESILGQKEKNTKKKFAFIASSAGGFGVMLLLLSNKYFNSKTSEKDLPPTVTESDAVTRDESEREVMGNAELGIFV